MPKTNGFDTRSVIADGSNTSGFTQPQYVEAFHESIGKSDFPVAQPNSDGAPELYDPNSGPDLHEGIHQQNLDLIYDHGNQVYVDPLIGINNGILDGYMAQSENIQRLIQDQIVQYDMRTTTQGTWPYGVDITTTYDGDGNTIGKEWKSHNGYSAYTNNDGVTTFKDSNGNEITEDEYKEGEGSWWQRFKEWASGGKGSSNITAETDIYLGNIVQFPGSQMNNGVMDVNDGIGEHIQVEDYLFVPIQSL